MKHKNAQNNDSEPSKRRCHINDVSSIESKRECMSVLPLERFSRTNPNFRQPMEIGSFSLDGKRAFHNDDRQLRYHVPPKEGQVLSFDLKVSSKGCVIYIVKVTEVFLILFVVFGPPDLKGIYEFTIVRASVCTFVRVKSLVTIQCFFFRFFA